MPHTQIAVSEAGTLFFAPKQELDRARNLNAPATDRTRLFATLARLNALYMIAKAGSGHIGSSFSSLDIVSWVYLNELRPGKDVYFSSKGHDAPGQYSVLTALGVLPFDKIHTLRRLGGLPGHPDIQTPGMVANTGSLGMGISKAKGMVRANRLKGVEGRVFLMTGDGELQEGQFWESLQSAANHRMHEITVVVDHNKLQSDTFVSNVSDLGDLVAKFKAFGWHVARCDGHDHAALAEVFREFATVGDKPKILIADTVKGAGVSFMAHTAMAEGQEFYRYHSGAPTADEYRRAAAELVADAGRQLAELRCEPLQVETVRVTPATPPANPQRLIPAYSEAIVAAAERHPELVALDADLITDTGLIPFRERFSQRFFECGIAEQDMVSQASGMALSGLLPVVHSFACFLTPRPNEQIFNACSEGKKIVFVGSLVGLLPAGPGHSHQSVRDISAMAAMPGITLVEPSCPAEVRPLLDWCVESNPGPSYMRLVSIPYSIPFGLPEGYRPEPGKGVTLRKGGEVAIIGYGPVLLSEAWRAADILAREGISAEVINLPWLNRIDAGWLKAALDGKRHLFALDNHFLIGGQGDRIAEALAGFGGDVKVGFSRIGIEGLPECGTNDEILAYHGLNAEGIAATVRRRLEGRSS